jgi:hypothetical protein
MLTMGLLSFVTFILLAQSLALALPSASRLSPHRLYSNASQPGVHSLPESYKFTARDGWMEYEVRSTLDFSALANKKQTLRPDTRLPGTVNDSRPRTSDTKVSMSYKNKDETGKSLSGLGAIGSTLQGIGNAIGVVITW